jgi:predicted MFS family arabinose efflux permease
LQQNKSALKHLWRTVANREYRIGFTATALLSVGGFMMMPFGSAFAVNNLGITQAQLPMLFMVSGVTSLFIMPIIGRLSDRVDKFRIFTIASVWLATVAVIYTNLSVTPLWLVMIFNILMMMGIMSRMVPSTALTSAVPDMPDRGAFMSVNSSLQQIAGGIAAAVAGGIVVQRTTSSPLENYNIIGYLMVVITIITIYLIHRVSVLVKRKLATKPSQSQEREMVAEGMV